LPDSPPVFSEAPIVAKIGCKCWYGGSGQEAGRPSSEGQGDGYLK
jgi:hypothetical protein